MVYLNAILSPVSIILNPLTDLIYLFLESLVVSALKVIHFCKYHVHSLSDSFVTCLIHVPAPLHQLFQKVFVTLLLHRDDFLAFSDFALLFFREEILVALIFLSDLIFKFFDNVV